MMMMMMMMMMMIVHSPSLGTGFPGDTQLMFEPSTGRTRCSTQRPFDHTVRTPIMSIPEWHLIAKFRRLMVRLGDFRSLKLMFFVLLKKLKADEESVFIRIKMSCFLSIYWMLLSITLPFAVGGWVG